MSYWHSIQEHGGVVTLGSMGTRRQLHCWWLTPWSLLYNLNTAPQGPLYSQIVYYLWNLVEACCKSWKFLSFFLINFLSFLNPLYFISSLNPRSHISSCRKGKISICRKQLHNKSFIFLSIYFCYVKTYQIKNFHNFYCIYESVCGGGENEDTSMPVSVERSENILQ